VLVRYEDLRAETPRALADACAAAGLSADGAAAIAERHSFDQVPEAERGESKAIRSAEPGGWRQTMTPAEQAALEEIMGPTLAELGYESGVAAAAA
jgi:hypothetical protein